jgi:hypothetical protein
MIILISAMKHYRSSIILNSNTVAKAKYLFIPWHAHIFILWQPALMYWEQPIILAITESAGSAGWLEGMVVSPRQTNICDVPFGSCYMKSITMNQLVSEKALSGQAS